MLRIRHWIFCFLFFIIKNTNEMSWSVNSEIMLGESYDTLTQCNTPNCTICPELGEICTDCCKSQNNLNVVCFNNRCRVCYIDSQWTCSTHNNNQDILMTATQIVMSAALILGIITIFTLFWKICSNRNQRQAPRRRNRHRRRESSRSGRSVDTLQQIVSERLRDAPPPYTRIILPTPGDTPPPYVASGGHVNSSFDPEYNVPPPSYCAIDNQQSQAVGNEGDKPVEPETDGNKCGENGIDPAIHI